MPSVSKLPAVIRGMDASDLETIAAEHGGLVDDPLSDEAYLAGFGLRVGDGEQVHEVAMVGPVPTVSLPEEVVNSTLVALLNPCDTLHPLIGEEPPVDDLAFPLDEELIDGIDRARELQI